MIDHLMSFASEATAHTALDPLGYGSGGTTWDQSRCIPNLQMVIVEPVWDNTNPLNPILVTPQQNIAGWWILISLPALNNTLKTMVSGGPACKIIYNRDLITQIYNAPVANSTQISQARIAPVFAGSTYTFVL